MDCGKTQSVILVSMHTLSGRLPQSFGRLFIARLFPFILSLHLKHNHITRDDVDPATLLVVVYPDRSACQMSSAAAAYIAYKRCKMWLMCGSYRLFESNKDIYGDNTSIDRSA